MSQVRISAKDLGVLALPNFCPRCFWIRMRCAGKLPFQIFPGIFSSIDSYTKKVTNLHFDRYSRLPSWLEELVELGKPVKVPHYSKFCVFDEETDVLLRGTPDEILQKDDGSHIVVDYKTAKFTKAQDSLLPLYEVQLNAYAYLGERQGFNPVSGLALVYMEPQTDLTLDQLDTLVKEEGFLMAFDGHVLEVSLQADKVIPPLLKEVRRIHDLESPPLSNEGCRDCQLLEGLIATATISS
ncbi:MAG: PD-(D/E)XK nuclease family protein [Candidatus Zixiibacteriota bacterium]|nr:MAG: PD-(D/E)XK nuclease family protein [candidate division Zixibacteria bacterium]